MTIRPRVLLVEGADDKRTIPELLELAGIQWSDPYPAWIQEYSGIEDLLADGAIDVQLKASGVEIVGIVVDANSNPTARWTALRQRLGRTYNALPNDVVPSGLVHDEAGKPRLGVWLMPNNVSVGMLESLLLEIRNEASNELRQHVASSLALARTLGARIKEAHIDKGELHTWLAWHDPPGLQLHMAVRRGAMWAEHPSLQAFVSWFRSLYGIA